MTEAQREALAEKAAIVEFESGLVDHIENDADRRQKAERLARKLLVEQVPPLGDNNND